MIDDDDTPPARVPEWFVSFADMMTLLMTMFVMLMSFSEPKKDDKFHAVVEQLQRQFGKDTSQDSVALGGTRARHRTIAKSANQARADRQQLFHGGPRATGLALALPRVRIVQAGTKSTIGATIFFAEGSAQLNDQARREVREQALQMAGKSQRIEIRGHTSQQTIEVGSAYADNWELAYGRSRAVMRYLIDEMKLDAGRIRISIAGPNEPLQTGDDPAKMHENPRVELYLLDEVVENPPHPASSAPPSLTVRTAN